MAERESELQKKIQNSLRLEKDMEQAKNSAVSVKSVSDLTKEVITQTVEKFTVYAKTQIDVKLRSFGAAAQSCETEPCQKEGA